MQKIKPEGFVQPADQWEILFQAKERGRTLDARVVGVDYPNGGPVWYLALDGFDGVRGIVPAAETGLGNESLMRRLAGQAVGVKIKGLDRDNGLVACSRRDAVAQNQERLLANVKVGDRLDCMVRAVMPRARGKGERLLLDVGGGVLVELPYADAAKRRSQPLAQQYLPGETVKAKVTHLDSDEGVIKVSVKDAMPDLWHHLDLRRGASVPGTVTSVRGRHVFIEPDVAPGIEGLADKPIVGDVRRGTRVNCVVATFNAENQKLRLRIRGVLA